MNCKRVGGQISLLRRATARLQRRRLAGEQQASSVYPSELRPNENFSLLPPQPGTLHVQHDRPDCDASLPLDKLRVVICPAQVSLDVLMLLSVCDHKSNDC